MTPKYDEAGRAGYQASKVLEKSQEKSQPEEGSQLKDGASGIRSEAKDRIRSDAMTLDGLTVAQINSIYDRSPKLRQSFQKILNIMTT